MPAKSRSGKARRFAQDKRREEIKRSAASPAAGTTVQPAAAVQAASAAAPADRAVRAGAATPKPGGAHYPFIRGELIRISLLTGVILVILFVLALVLPRV